MQLSLFYDYESIYKSSSFFQKYETLFLAVEAVTDEQTLRKSTGRLGYGPICFLKALIYKNAQQISSIPELIRDLESRPLICEMIGFPFGKLPDSSNFYRFLDGHNNLVRTISRITELPRLSCGNFARFTVRRKAVFSWVMPGMMNGNSIISSRKISRVNPISPSIPAISRNPRPWDRITAPSVMVIWR